MKNILLVALIASIGISSFANAEGREGGRGGYRGGYYRGGSGMEWIAPLAIGGLIGYELNRQPTVTAQRPPIIYQQAPAIVNVQPNQPIYQYQNIYDTNCACYHQVLVQIN